METQELGKRFSVVIAAGGVAPEAVQRREYVLAKGELSVGGTACVTRVCTAVLDAGLPGVVVGGPRIEPLVAGLGFVAERSGAIANFRAGVEALPSAPAIVFLPSDAPFLTGDCLRDFAMRLAAEEGEWLAMGVTSASVYAEAFPEAPKKSVRMREGRMHSGALYAGSRAGFLQTLDALEGMFRDRRSQLAMAKRVGVWQAIRFGLGLLDFAEAAALFERVSGVRGVAVHDCDPGMVVDIDDLMQLDQARAIYRRLVQ